MIFENIELFQENLFFDESFIFMNTYINKFILNR